MRLTASSGRQPWLLAACGAAVAAALIGLWLVPPGTLPYPPAGSYSDAAVSHWPNAHFLRQSVLREHRWPLWDPTRMLGQPFAANPLTKVWYPPQWLALILPPTAHLNLLTVAHMVIMALGMLVWARAAGLRLAAGLLAASAWALLPKSIAHLGAGHLDVLYALGWVPWLMAAARRLRERPVPQRAALVGVLAALLMLADLRIAAYLLLPALLDGLLADGREPIRRGLWLLAGLIVVLLTAVQSFPLLALAPYLTRAALTPAQAAEFSLPPSHLIGVLLADRGGFHEWMTFLGIPLLTLGVAGLIRGQPRRLMLGWAAMALLAALWALGDRGPLFAPAAKLLPLLSWLRIPSRAWFVVSLAVIVLAAHGLDALLARPLPRGGRLAAAGLASAGVVWLAASASVVGQLPAGVRGAFVGAGVSLIATGAGCWLTGRGPLPRRFSAIPALRVQRAGAALLIGVLALSYLMLDRSLIEGRPVSEVSAADAALAARLDAGCRRVYSPSFDLLGPGAAQAGLWALHGADPFQLAASADLIAAAAGVSLEGYSITAPPIPPESEDVRGALRAAHPDTALLAAFDVRWVVARFPVEDSRLTFRGRNGGVWLYQLADGAARADAAGLPPDSVILPAACGGPDHFRWQVSRYAADSPLNVVIAQAWAPGWRAEVDGRPIPIRQVGGGLIGVALPPGASTLELAYRPRADLAGAAISGTAAGGLSVWALAGRRKGAA